MATRHERNGAVTKAARALQVGGDRKLAINTREYQHAVRLFWYLRCMCTNQGPPSPSNPTAPCPKRWPVCLLYLRGLVAGGLGRYRVSRHRFPDDTVVSGRHVFRRDVLFR